jgi:hypothetical protein
MIVAQKRVMMMSLEFSLFVELDLERCFDSTVPWPSYLGRNITRTVRKGN